MQQLIDFAIAAGKLAISAIFAIVLIAVAYLVFFVVREAAWVARHENRRKYEKQEEDQDK